MTNKNQPEKTVEGWEEDYFKVAHEVAKTNGLKEFRDIKIFNFIRRLLAEKEREKEEMLAELKSIVADHVECRNDDTSCAGTMISYINALITKLKQKG